MSAPTYLGQNLSELVLSTPGFDDLSLLGETTDADGNTFTIMAQAEEATFDNPVPIDVAVQRWMTDGAIASTQGHDNREPFFKLVVSAGTSAALAAGEAALAKRASKFALLSWISPEGFAVAPTSVFEIWTWHLENTFDVDRENRIAGMYGIRMTAKPWVRSADLTTAAALTTNTAVPAFLSIDTCTTTTNWTATGGTLSTSGGAVRVTVSSVPAHTPGTLSLTRTAAVTGLAALPYLMVDTATSGATLTSMTVQVNGITLTKVATVGSVGYYAFASGTTSFTTLKVTAGLTTGGSPSTVQLAVADVSATDTIGGIGSGKQLSRSLDVGGSVTTSGSIQLASPSATRIGAVLAYTSTADTTGFSPPLRQYRTSGNAVTADGTCVSGNHEDLVTAGASAGTITYTIPALREATYVLVGRFLFDSAATVTVTVGSKVTGWAADTITGTVSATGVASIWGVLGTLSLPNQALPGESTVSSVITVSATADAGTHTLDELYLIDVTHGDFSLVRSAGLNYTRMWLDAPDADPVRNRPAIYVGTAADRSDAVRVPYAQILAMGDHDLDPDGASLLTVTDGVAGATVTASFYRRWHTRAGT